MKVSSLTRVCSCYQLASCSCNNWPAAAPLFSEKKIDFSLLPNSIFHFLLQCKVYLGQQKRHTVHRTATTHPHCCQTVIPLAMGMRCKRGSLNQKQRDDPPTGCLSRKITRFGHAKQGSPVRDLQFHEAVIMNEWFLNRMMPVLWTKSLLNGPKGNEKVSNQLLSAPHCWHPKSRKFQLLRGTGAFTSSRHFSTRFRQVIQNFDCTTLWLLNPDLACKRLFFSRYPKPCCCCPSHLLRGSNATTDWKGAVRRKEPITLLSRYKLTSPGIKSNNWTDKWVFHRSCCSSSFGPFFAITANCKSNLQGSTLRCTSHTTPSNPIRSPCQNSNLSAVNCFSQDQFCFWIFRQLKDAAATLFVYLHLSTLGLQSMPRKTRRSEKTFKYLSSGRQAFTTRCLNNP